MSALTCLAIDASLKQNPKDWKDVRPAWIAKRDAWREYENMQFSAGVMSKTDAKKTRERLSKTVKHWAEVDAGVEEDEHGRDTEMEEEEQGLNAEEA